MNSTVNTNNNTIVREQGDYHEVKTFNDISIANEYLRKNNNIKNVVANFQIKNSLGALANHTRAGGVTLNIIRTKQKYTQVYQLAEHEYTRLLIVDRSDMVSKLQGMNPDKKIVHVDSYTNQRGKSGIGFMLGIGVQSHRSVFVTYIQNINDTSALRF